MRFTRGWLEEHLDFKASDTDLQERLTAIGLEVEEWHSPAERYQAFVVAHVLECRPHPRAQRLSVCSVRFDAASEPVQVVCGAPNVRKGFVGVFAPVGSVVPATGLRLKAASLQGEPSHGMLLSEWELGLSEEHEGILEIKEEQGIGKRIGKDIGKDIGKPFAESQGLDDPVCSIAVMPNRADCLGVRGIARDLAAAGMGRLKPLPKPSFKESFEPMHAWRIDLPAALAHHCPFVCGRSFRNLKNAQAPKHIRARLKAVGINSLSALVDMTNYMTLDLARPLHVFDAQKLAGNALTIRKAHNTTSSPKSSQESSQESPSESLAALDHKTYALPSGASVIADAKGVVGMAGIMGGIESGCSEETQEMFLECALFDPRTTAAVGRALNIESEARFRFERGLDPAAAVEGCNRATELVLAWCGGEASKMTSAGSVEQTKRRIFLPKGHVQKLGGIALEQKSIDAILEKLGFDKEKENQGKGKEGKEKQGKEKEEKGCFYVPPSWRADATTSACLVEEVLRIHGYDAIPDAPFVRTTTLSERAISRSQKRDALVRRRLALAGLYETVTWSFSDSTLGDLFAHAQDSHDEDSHDDGLRLQNPISAQLDCLRPTLLLNLAQTAAHNRSLGRRNTALFEVGPQFAYRDDKVCQEQVAAGVRVGAFETRHWHSPLRDADLFDVKADLRSVFEACGLDSERLDSQSADTNFEGYHPYRCGCFLLGRTMIGRFGELHPTLCRRLGLRERAVAFEAFLDRIPAGKSRIAPKGWQRQKQQSLYRDFACWIPEGLTAAALKSAVLRRARNSLKSLIFFDRYRYGSGSDDGETSLAFEVEILPHAERALSEAEVQALSQEIVDCLQGLGCRMREG